MLSSLLGLFGGGAEGFFGIVAGFGGETVQGIGELFEFGGGLVEVTLLKGFTDGSGFGVFAEGLAEVGEDFIQVGGLIGGEGIGVVGVGSVSQAGDAGGEEVFVGGGFGEGRKGEGREGRREGKRGIGLSDDVDGDEEADHNQRSGEVAREEPAAAQDAGSLRREEDTGVCQQGLGEGGRRLLARLPGGGELLAQGEAPVEVPCEAGHGEGAEKDKEGGQGQGKTEQGPGAAVREGAVEVMNPPADEVARQTCPRGAQKEAQGTLGEEEGTEAEEGTEDGQRRTDD